MRAQEFVSEISDERLQDYLSRAGKKVDSRLERMARARDRLNKGYEIYHADRPAGSAQIVDRFEANTPALAQRYYEKFIHNYESDVDFDLRLRRATGIMEIARIPQGDFGDEDTLTLPKDDVEKKELPGGAGFTYAVNKTGTGDLEIMIFDGDTLAAELDLFETQDVTGAWRVNTVAVDPRYRSRGLGKALYGIALSILKLTVEAGDTQTKHGQRMWLMLNSIPGVEVVGYNMEPTEKYQPRKNDKIVAQDDTWTRYTFPIKPGKHSMRSTRRGTGMYTTQASMLAKWTGKKGLVEINDEDELSVSQRIQDYFTDRGYGYLGEGRDQIAFLSPRGTVVKVLGIGEDEREDIVKSYVGFFSRNQRNPHYPRIYNAGDFKVDGETYFVYEMEYLNPVSGEDQVLEYIEDLMSALPRGEQALAAFYKNKKRPPGLSEEQVDGLVFATQDLEDAIGGQAPLDLRSIENLGRRKDGQIVIIDPFSL